MSSENYFNDSMKMFTDPQNFNNFFKNMGNIDMNFAMNNYKKGAEMLSSAAQIMADSIQALAKRNAEIIQNNTNHAFNAVKEMCSVTSPEQAINKQQTLAKQSVEHVMQNTREIAEMVSKSGLEVLELFGKKINENFNDYASNNNNKKKTTN